MSTGMDSPDYYAQQEFTNTISFPFPDEPDGVAALGITDLLSIIDPMYVIRPVLLTRVLHLLIDLTLIPRLKLLKQLTTILIGGLMLRNYTLNLADNIAGLQFGFLIGTVIFILSIITDFSGRLPTMAVLALSTAPIALNEYFIFCRGRQEFTKLRTPLSTLTMKFVSQSSRRPEATLSKLSHFLHPASCVLGPWHHNFVDVRSTRTELRSQFFLQAKLFSIAQVKSLVMLTVEMSCLDSLLEYLNESGHGLANSLAYVYLVAQQFRFGHYYVCFMTEGLVNLWSDVSQRPYRTCEVSKVELPRSLVEVVISWNIPMHTWLKNYIFVPTKCRTRNLTIAIGLTYVMSSMLHGFKFHIWAVLSSLGLLTWIEHRLRHKLADVLGACVLARRCSYTKDRRCLKNHARTEHNSWTVTVVNTCLRILAMAHLAYLGFIFQGNTDELGHEVAVFLWSEVYFFGHMLLLLELLVGFATCF